MLSGEKDLEKILWQAVKTGCASMMMTMALLIPAAIAIEKGITDPAKGKVIGILCLLMSAIISQVLVSTERGGAISSLISALIITLLVLLLTASMKNTVFSLKGLLPVSGAGFAGTMIGSVLKKGKKENHAAKRRKKYNR